MQQPTRDDIRSLCTAQSFERGVNYYEQGRIQELDVDDGRVEAVVRGTHDYRVSIDLTGDDIRTQCSCPYDYAGDCKHIVAVLLAVSDEDESITTAEDDRGTENAAELVDRASPETLRAFVADAIEQDRELRDRFAAFVGEDTGKTVHDYKREIDRWFDDATDRGGMVDYHTHIDFSHYGDLAETCRSRGDVTEAVKIYRALSETIRENLSRIDDGGGYYGRRLEEAIRSYAECLTEAELDHEEKRESIEYLVEQFLEAEYGFVREYYDDALRELCTTTGDLEHWRGLLEPHVPEFSPAPTVEGDGDSEPDGATTESDDEEQPHDTEPGQIEEDTSGDGTNDNDEVPVEDKGTDVTTLRVGDLTSGPLDVDDFTGNALDISRLGVGPLEAEDFVGDAFESAFRIEKRGAESTDEDRSRRDRGATLTGRFPSRTRDSLSSYLHLLRELDDREALLGLLNEIYLENQEFCREYTELLIDEGRDRRAIEVVKDGIEAFRSPEDLRRLAVDLYRDYDAERYREILKQLFLNHEDWEAYDELKRVCHADVWKSIYDEIVFAFEETGNRRRLIDLYLYEGDREKAFRVVVESGSLPLLRRYRRDVGDVDPEAYFEAYRERLVPFLANDTGRDHYRDVIRHLEAMRDLGLDDEFSALVEHLREKHSNRPAFLDELDKAGL